MIAVVGEVQNGLAHAVAGVLIADVGVRQVRQIALLAVLSVDAGAFHPDVALAPSRSCSSDQVGAACKHAVGIGHGSGGPPSSHVDGRQCRTVREHAIHVCDLARRETAQVNLGKLRAAVEHARSQDDIGGVQVLQASDVLQVAHAEEPVVGVCGPCVGKRRLEHHMLHVGAIGRPHWVHTVLGQTHGALGPVVYASESVVVEGQRSCRVVEYSISLQGQQVGQIARYRRAAANHGIGFVGMSGIEHGSVSAYQVGASAEHIIRNGHCAGVPTSGYDDGLQLCATVEHVLHVRDVAGRETRQVECRQLGTAVKHVAHIVHLCSIQV